MPKAKKDPNKPKGVKSAYIFFVEAQRAERERNGDQLPFTELSKKCGEMWGDMSANDKEKFVKLSEKDKKRHEFEMRSYVPPEAENNDSDSDDDRPKKKKKMKDPNAPKRPITAYFYFAAHMRPEIKKEHGALSVTETATIIGQKWRQLSANDKVEYEEQAAGDKARYLKEQAAYNKTR